MWRHTYMYLMDAHSHEILQNVSGVSDRSRILSSSFWAFSFAILHIFFFSEHVFLLLSRHKNDVYWSRHVLDRVRGETGEAAAWREAEAEAGHIASAHTCDVTCVRGLLGGKPPHRADCSWVALGMAWAAAAAWGPTKLWQSRAPWLSPPSQGPCSC